MASFFDIRARQAAATAAAGSSKSAAQPENNRLQPWVEKYRPKSLDDVAAQDHTVDVLRRTLQSANLPHMLFYGPPGTGKTSTVLALAKQLFGPELVKTRVLELNASDERGISIVREKVKDFARMQLSNPPAGAAGAAYRAAYPCPPYKIVVLDEADSMTQDAQSALRRTMETYSRLTRFCLVCNYVTRIIDPLASRCSKFRFKPLAAAAAGRRLADIAALERVRLEEGVVDTLLRCADGDLRKAITFLQSAARLAGAAQDGAGGAAASGDKKRKRKIVADDEDGEEENGGGGGGDNDDAMDVDSPAAEITVRSVEEIAGVIPDDTVESLLAAMRPRSKSAPASYGPIAQAVEDLVAEGWSAAQIVTQLYDKTVLSDESIGDWAKNRIVLCFSQTDKRLVDGSDEHLTILDLCLQIAGILGDDQ